MREAPTYSPKKLAAAISAALDAAGFAVVAKDAGTLQAVLAAEYERGYVHARNASEAEIARLRKIEEAARAFDDGTDDAPMYQRWAALRAALSEADHD